MGVWILGLCTSARLFWLLLPLGLSAFLTSPKPQCLLLACAVAVNGRLVSWIASTKTLKATLCLRLRRGQGQTRLMEGAVFMAESSSNNAALLSGAPGFCF